MSRSDDVATYAAYEWMMRYIDEHGLAATVLLMIEVFGEEEWQAALERHEEKAERRRP